MRWRWREGTARGEAPAGPHASRCCVVPKDMKLHRASGNPRASSGCAPAACALASACDAGLRRSRASYRGLFHTANNM